MVLFEMCVIYLAIPGTEGYTPKMEDWGSVNRAAFPSTHGVNGIDKSSIDTDTKYPQVTAFSRSQYIWSNCNPLWIIRIVGLRELFFIILG